MRIIYYASLIDPASEYESAQGTTPAESHIYLSVGKSCTGINYSPVECKSLALMNCYCPG